jgi:hypothetical protein
MPIPAYWSGRLVAGDLSPDFALPAGSIAQGGLIPDKIGLPFTNKTGGTLTAGTLVYVSGWDATTDRPSVTKASASALGTSARWIVLADTLNNASGTIGQHLSLTAQNTNAANVGDPVYLNTTAGAFTLTNPPAAPVMYQQVGTVRTKSATVGIVELRILGQPLEQPLEKPQGFFPTIATTGTTESSPIRIARGGGILGINLAFNTALSINGSNYVTFAANNRSQSKLLTQAVVANSTNTGGTAITQYGGYPLTLTATAGDLLAVANDVVTVSATVTGTLGGALGPGSVSLVYAPN